MMQKLVMILIIGLMGPSYSMAADLRCGKNIVSEGDTTSDVFMKCNEPEWRDHSVIEKIEEITHGEWRKAIINREVWLYNWGPNKFMTELIFSNDKLVEIKPLRYGYLEKDVGSSGNDVNKLYIQMSKPEVLIHWGDPDFKTEMIEERVYKVEENKYLKYNVTISKWIYSFGSNRLQKTLIFENDRLIEIVSGEYGYDK